MLIPSADAFHAAETFILVSGMLVCFFLTLSRSGYCSNLEEDFLFAVNRVTQRDIVYLRYAPDALAGSRISNAERFCYSPGASLKVCTV